MYIKEIVEKQKNFFKSGETKDIKFRINQLKRLRDMMIEKEKEITSALKEDMAKPDFESYASEIHVSLEEIKYALNHIDKWVKPLKVTTPKLYLFSKSLIHPEPKGVVLIISAWNYPIQQIICPLVGAIASGNCAILKPSEIASKTAETVSKIISDYFLPEYITVVQGGPTETQELINNSLDHILFTGSPAVGKIIMASAAPHLTPVTLELGGKSPCIVDETADLKVAAKRIVWGKIFNAGQTCVAPDYLYVHSSVKNSLIEEMKKSIDSFLKENSEGQKDYAKIINEKHFNRLVDYLNEGRIIYGGESDSSSRFIKPTLIEGLSDTDKLMQEEIFGPILPILEYDNLNDVINYINKRPKPLSLYFFSRDKNKKDRIIRETSSGGVTINDTMIHIATVTLPFGGVGNSGFGSYHGKTTFDTFTHHKSIMIRPFWPDSWLRYPPYKISMNLLKSLLRFLS